MREIVLDTETTGLSAANGDRITEIGCVELQGHLPTGKEYHVYINPQCEISEKASEVSGLTNSFLADKPLFADIVEELLAFIGDARLVIHNAEFDMGFLNAELARLKKPLLPVGVEHVVDSLTLARSKFPNAANSLDALCRRFEIDLSERTTHSAILDAKLLADVYLEMIGGRQKGFIFSAAQAAALAGNPNATPNLQTQEKRPTPLPSRLTEEEKKLHAEFVASFDKPSCWGS